MHRYAFCSLQQNCVPNKLTNTIFTKGVSMLIEVCAALNKILLSAIISFLITLFLGVIYYAADILNLLPWGYFFVDAIQLGSFQLMKIFVVLTAILFFWFALDLIIDQKINEN